MLQGDCQLDFNQKYQEYLTYFNKNLNEYFNELADKVPKELYDAMYYACAFGGKRVRPVLCLATAEMLGLNLEEVKYFALAIEFIHSYSLIHDDLPSMDNDDFRRGNLSTHKKFGEATAILAGDALLNLASEVCLKKKHFTNADVSAMKVLFYCSGAQGMIRGQALDLKFEKAESFSQDVLIDIFSNKTAKLISAPITISSLLSGREYLEQLSEYANKLGLLFQICDDILDEEGSLEQIGKTPHKDSQADKLTSVKFYGLEGAKEWANRLYEDCKTILSNIPNSQFLSDFTDMLISRKS